MSEPTQADLARMVRQQPTRRLVDRRCEDCGRTWTQPSSTGACPSCHGTRVTNVGGAICSLRQA